MSITIYNTLTRQKEEFVPLEPGKVKIYVCGPTVYNHIHIGNARSTIFFDVVRRYMQYRGYEVYYVHNFTDVDDKIIDAAKQNNQTTTQVAEQFIASYLSICEALGVQEADLYPKVTENMEDIIAFIEQLIQKGFAYEAGGDVYFRTESFVDYGKLSHQNTDQLLSGVRIEVGEHKETSLDFTLWKKAKKGEISWASPWGKGRPGWHIECSAMIKKHLGETIDIHGGGMDLTFPHHENEIAQTESLTSQPLATYWMHNALLTIDDQKMSKSLGNFILAYEVLEQYDPETIRFFMLSGHYRTPINYSEDLLRQAQKGYERLQNTAANLDHYLQHKQKQSDESEELEESHRGRTVQEWKNKFIAAMDDDFNTANAMSILFELGKEANSYLQTEKASVGTVRLYLEEFTRLASILGFQLGKDADVPDAEIDQLIKERNEARKSKDYGRADEIRDQLAQKNIVLEDTPQGVRWRRK